MHLGGQEIWIVLGIIVLLFGAKKLPELGRSLGDGIKEFRKSAKTIVDDTDNNDQTKTANSAKEANGE